MKPFLAIAGLWTATFVLLFLSFLPDFYVMAGSVPASWQKSMLLSLEERLFFSFIAASIIAAVAALIAGLVCFMRRLPMWRKRFATLCAAGATMLAIAACAYILTFGHCFLPLPSGHSFPNERIEMRMYPSGFDRPNNSSTAFSRAIWVLTRPGQARLLAAAKRLEAAAPNQRHGLKEVMEAMGYDFPPGCGAGSGGIVPGWNIAHYPSMLRRIEKDLQLIMIWRELPEQDESSPNDQVGAGVCAGGHQAHASVGVGGHTDTLPGDLHLRPGAALFLVEQT